MRNFCLIALIVFLLSPPVHAATLTGAISFGADADGAFTSSVWNTRSDAYFNLYLRESGTFLNSGNGPAVAPSFTLVAGNTYVIEIRGEPGGVRPYYGLNLFFNGGTLPAISVYRQNNGVGAVLANSSASTLAQNGTSVAGSGTLSFVDGSDTITLTAYDWFTSPTAGSDLIDAYNNVSNGNNDYVGSFTLQVTSASGPPAVPEPTTTALLGLGLMSLCLLKRR